MKTKEERARIARENGAKSKGPTSEQGKAKSRLNSLKTGEHAQKLAHYIPAHEAVLCNEDRDQYRKLVDEFIAIYKPANQEALNVIRDMATARWQIERLHRHITIQWNVALIDAAKKHNPLLTELHEMHSMSLAIGALLSGNSLLSKLNREVTRLQQALARSERRLKFLNEHFPDPAPIPEEIEKEEVTASEPGENAENEPPIYVTENVPLVINAYRREFPGRRIVILPPDDVAKGVNVDDNLPFAPRKVA